MSSSLYNNFIKATEKFNTFTENVPAPYMRKTFISDTCAKAKITVAACGFYELYFNAKRITKGFLAPYISNTDDYIYFDEYTVDVDCGENVIALLLGNGLQNNPGGYVWNFDKAPFRSAPMVAVCAEYTDANGNTVAIVSDESFKTYPSPIKCDDYRFGEVYDANFELAGWNEKGFDDSLWKSTIKANPPRGELRLCDAEPIVEECRRKPVNIFKEDDGFVYDFGINDTGLCMLNIKNTVKGQTVELRYGEILIDGKFQIENIWFPYGSSWNFAKNFVHKDVYICKGEKEEQYMPTFTYHGFRYVKVSGITEEQATEALLTYAVIHSDLKTCGDFTCSDEVANAIQTMARRSATSNFHYFPTDCPHREKNGWTADAALSCEYVLLNFTAEKSYAEWMRNICKAQNKNGALPGIVPTSGWGFEWGNGPAWDSVLLWIPYYMYVYRGNTEVIRESAASFMAYLNYLTTRADENGLMHIGLGDWCHRNDGDFPPTSPLELTDTVMSMDIADKAAFLFDAVGMTAQRDFARTVAESFRTAARKHLIDHNTCIALGDCQTSQAMCIYYNIFTEDEKSKAVEHLIEQIHAKNDFFDVGVLGARVLFHVLSENGYGDLAYKMITRPEHPSYGYSVAQGMTTLVESFKIWHIDSRNHHFWGDVSAWFIKRVAGIQFNPAGNDIKRVDIKPAFIEKLNDAEAYYDAPDGRISVSWRREENGIVLNVSVPSGIKAEATLPTGYFFADGTDKKSVVSGEYIITK